MQSALVSPVIMPYAGGEPAKKVVRFHPLRRLRIERWTMTHAVAAVVIGALSVFATFAAWQHIYGLASKYNDEYTHILLVPIVAAWMVFARRQRIRHCKPIGTLLGVLIAALGWAVHVYGYYNGYQTLWHSGAVLVLLGCVVAVLGKHVLFRFFPAVAVLIFLIPVPPQYRLKISQPLQIWTAEVSQAVLEMFNVPVVRKGQKLFVNETPLNVVEACNGMRMVFSLILVSYAFSFGLPLRNWVRLIVLAASPISAILCNVIRIVPTACVYGYVSESAGLEFHDWAGWVMLPIAFIILLGVLRILRWAMIPVMKYSLAA